MLTKKQGFLCAGCHGTDPRKNFTAVASRHQPVVEGQCSACHNPHKSELPHLVLAQNPDLCLACHTELKAALSQAVPAAEEAPNTQAAEAEDTEKALQRFYIHAPEEIGKCGICHLPHQGPEAALMTEPIQPLCSRCHDYGSQSFDTAHLGIEARRIDCRKCHTPHVSKDPRLFKSVLHQPFSDKSCKDCHLVEGS
jgi:predicted CXXCH cytochrome family protein